MEGDGPDIIDNKIRGESAEVRMIDEMGGITRADLVEAFRIMPTLPQEKPLVFPGDLLEVAAESAIEQGVIDRIRAAYRKNAMNFSTEGLERAFAQVANPARQPFVISFTYPRDCQLMISVQQRDTESYYDFATKTFKQARKETDKFSYCFRAGMTKLGEIGSGEIRAYFYTASIGRVAKLSGQYVVTVRDMEAGGVVVALLSYSVKDGKVGGPGVIHGVDMYEPEQHLSVFGTAGRPGRAIEIGD
jgi:hypothetical protein